MTSVPSSMSSPFVPAASSTAAAAGAVSAVPVTSTVAGAIAPIVSTTAAVVGPAASAVTSTSSPVVSSVATDGRRCRRLGRLNDGPGGRSGYLDGCRCQRLQSSQQLLPSAATAAAPVVQTDGPGGRSCCLDGSRRQRHQSSQQLLPSRLSSCEALSRHLDGHHCRGSRRLDGGPAGRLHYLDGRHCHGSGCLDGGPAGRICRLDGCQCKGSNRLEGRHCRGSRRLDGDQAGRSCFLGCQYRRLNRLYGCLCRSSGPLGRRPWGWIGACHGHGSSRLEGDPAGWLQYLDSRHGHGSGCPEGGQLVGSNASTVATATAPVVSKAASWSALPSRRSSLPWLRSYRRTRHRRSPTHCPGRRKIESGLGSFVKPAVVPTNRPDGAHCCSSSVGRADFLAGLVIHGPLPDPTDEKRPRLEELAALGGGLMMRSPLSIPPQLFHP